MSHKVTKSIVCPKCTETTQTDIYTSINAFNNPELREEALDETLFKWRCNACGHEARLTYPVLYNDMKNRFMIYLIPRIERFQLADRELEEEFKNLKNINKRLVPDFNSFKEKVFIFESGLNDMAVEVTKLAISEAVAKKHNLEAVTEGYLSMYDRESNTMGFTFFIGEGKTPYVQSARLEIYGKSMSIVKEFAAKDKKLKGFIKIDREWAENVLYRYKRAKHHLQEQLQDAPVEKPKLKKQELEKKKINLEIVTAPVKKKDTSDEKRENKNISTEINSDEKISKENLSSENKTNENIPVETIPKEPISAKTSKEKNND